jgi:glycosyltransferase involved in cell wall biosynthesis
MPILVVAYGPMAHLEGYHLRIARLSLALSEEGHKVTILWFGRTRSALPALRQMLPTRVAVLHIPMLPLFAFRWFFAFGKWICAFITKVIFLAGHFKCVQAENPFCARLAAFCNPEVLCVDWHGDVVAELEMGGAPGWRVELAEEDEALALNGADVIISASKALHQHLHAKWKKVVPGVVVPSCVDVGEFWCSKEERSRTRAGWGTAGRLVVCYSGGLQKWQCIDETLRLAAELKRLEPSVFLLLITQGDVRPFATLLSEVGEEGRDYKVVRALPGDVPGLLQAADIGLLLREKNPVNSVASPTKFGEYLAAGLPVIACEGAGDAATIIRETGCGILLDDPTHWDGDRQRLRDFMSSVCAEREAWAQRTKSFVSEHRSWEGVQADIASVYSLAGTRNL